MYTAHHPCWDAKNRYGLPEEMAFDYAGIAHIIEAPVRPEAGRSSKQDAIFEQTEKRETAREEKAAEKTVAAEPMAPDKKEDSASSIKETMFIDSNPDNIPQALKDLMQENNVTEWDIQNVVAARGYYPGDTPVEKYDAGFIQGVLVGAWPKVYGMIQTMKEKQEIPFN